jgi:protein gp37
VTSYIDAQKALTFSKTYPNHIKFISFEPLLGDPKIPEEVFKNIQWIIIGAESGNRKGKVIPKLDWIWGLLNAADKHFLPVYMKDTLQPYWYHYLRKEFPKKK